MTKRIALYVENRAASYFGRHRMEEHDSPRAAHDRARELAGELGQDWLVRLVVTEQAQRLGVERATFATYEGRMG